MTVDETRPRPPTLRRRTPVAVSIALVASAMLAVAGCGSSRTVGKDGTLRVALTEYRVIPQSVHTRTGVLTLVVHNYGRLTHDLVISDAGHADIATDPIAPGQTSVLSAALIPGSYQMYSSILSDQALGAYGTLDVNR
ncbi:MAG: hypothetical protein ACRDMX_15975 [Solirubrobacteraceae bacterium]